MCPCPLVCNRIGALKPVGNWCALARALLVITIATMVLISIHPFAFRKIFLLAAALLGFSSAFCFADSLFMARQYAPSQNRSRSTHFVAQPQGNPGPDFVLGSFESPAVKNFGRLQTAAFLDRALGETELGIDQVFPSGAAPFSQMPACLPTTGLILALPVPHGTEVASF
jgi:hypothetical protein